jgi:2-polyprenyl-6-methoxyphenol hydroxylase-like FAD-dependent oxidoreductase
MTVSSSILIVGAGPTGLTAAIELARRGLKPRIISRNDGPVHESRALGISRRSLDILAPSGATARLREIGHRIRALNLRTAKRPLFRVPFPGADDPVPLLMIVPQSEIEQVLVETLRGLGVEVEWQTELRELHLPATPRATIRGPGGDEILTPDIVIGADGAHSRTRHALGIGFPGGAYETDWGLADCRIDTELALDEGHIFDLAPVLFVVLPIRENLVRFICDRRDVLAHVPPGIAVKSVEWESGFRISHRQAETYQSGCVFLAGDAAHIHSPVGARGMNLGIEDAAWLAWMIASGTTDGYTKVRWPVGRKVLKTVDPVTRLMASDAAPLRFARRHILPRAIGIAALRKRMVGRIIGLDTPAPPWLG